MADEYSIYNSYNRHLLTEDPNRKNVSFIANVNTVAEFFRNPSYIEALIEVPTIKVKYQECLSNYEEVKGNVDNIITVVTNLNSKVRALDDLNIPSKFQNINLNFLALDARVSRLEEGGGAPIPELENYYTKAETDYLLNGKEAKGYSYAKSEVDNKIGTKLDAFFGLSEINKILMVGPSGYIITSTLPSFSWGNIQGNIGLQTDLMDMINLKADKTEIRTGTLTMKDKYGTVRASFNGTTDVSVTMDSGVSSYNELTDKPSINGIILIGNTDIPTGMVLDKEGVFAYHEEDMPIDAIWKALARTNTSIAFANSVGVSIYNGINFVNTVAIPLVNDISTNGELYVAVKANSDAVTAGRGSDSTWSEYSDGSGIQRNWVACCYGKSKFVTVSNMGQIKYSPDGMLWILGPNLDTEISDIQYVPSLDGFVVVGDGNNKIGFSTNLTNWEFKEILTSNGKHKIVPGVLSFLVLGTATTSCDIFTRFDTPEVSEIVPNESDFTDGTLFKNKFYVTVNGVGVFSSSTGKDWKQEVMPAVAQFSCIIGDNDKLYVGTGVTSPRSVMYVGEKVAGIIQNGTDITEDVKELMDLNEIYSKLNVMVNSVYFPYNTLSKSYSLASVSSVVEVSPDYGYATLNITDSCMIRIAPFTVGTDIDVSEYNAGRITLAITFSSTYTVTWASNIKFPDGTVPELSTTGLNIVELVTFNKGTTWYGNIIKNIF